MIRLVTYRDAEGAPAASRRLYGLRSDSNPVPAWIPANRDVYLAHFLSLIDTADEVPCISHCTERDIRAFAEAQGRRPPAT